MFISNSLIRSVPVFAFALFGVIPAIAAGQVRKLDFERDSLGKRIAFSTEAVTYRSAAVSQAKTSASRVRAQVDTFLAAHREAMGIGNPNITLRHGSVRRDDGRTHLRSYQEYKGIPVHGKMGIFHLNESRQIVSGNIDFLEEISLDVTPTITARQAEEIGKVLWGQEHSDAALADTEEANLVVLPMSVVDANTRSDVKLAWIVKVGSAIYDQMPGDIYYIDAKTGEVLKTQSSLVSLVGTPAQYRVAADCTSYLLGYPTPKTCYYSAAARTTPLPTPTPTAYVLGRHESRPPRGPFPYNYNPTMAFYYGSQDIDRYYDIMGAIGNYMFTTHDRDGPNFHGGMVITPVPTIAATPPGIQRPLSNIYSLLHWDAVANPGYCPDAGFNRQNLSVAPQYIFCHGEFSPDVVGHEYAHSLVYFNIDAGQWYLPLGTSYTGQPGALEESYCDVFGAAAEEVATGLYDWKIGRWQDNPQGVYPSNNDPRIRDAVNPTSVINANLAIGLPYPDHFISPNYYCGSADNGGVHHNSTVVSKAFSLLVDGGDFNGCHINGIGMLPTQKILYSAWLNYFTYNVTFNQAYSGFISACNALYGTTNPSYCTELTNALQAVGLNQNGNCPQNPANEQAPGCAVHNEGTGLTTTNANWYTTITQFAPGEEIWVRGTSAMPSKILKGYMRPHAAPPLPNWTTLTQPVVNVVSDPYGRFNASFGVASSEADGLYDLVIDGNIDGFYQPWADSLLSIEIRTPQDGDGVCYQGETVFTSENCMRAPMDCGCRSTQQCEDVTCPGEVYPGGAVYGCVPKPVNGRLRPRYCLAW